MTMVQSERGTYRTIDGIRERWEALLAKWRSGDHYLFYRRPEQPWLNDLGIQEGVVLIRGCDQLGFVTTSLATETASGGLAPVT